jgi:predicted  nucleic acid-binding Zn-ribbon protein
VAEISHENRLEVAMLYLRGNTYKEIETKTGLSHGSISNIVNKLLSGQLVIPGVPSDEVSDLHQLSVDLKKKNLEPSQALLGLTLFEKFNELGIVPSQFDQWSKLVKVCVPDDFPAKDFFETALHLHKLEEAENKPFQEIAQEYASMLQKVGEIRDEVDSLDVKKKGLAVEVDSLTSEISALENKREEIKGLVEAQCVKLEEARSVVAAAKEDHAHLSGEIKDLIKKKDELQSELGTKGESLSKLKKIGLSEKELLRLVKLLAGMAEEENVDTDQVKDEFFLSLDQFKNYSGLHKAVEEERGNLQSIVKQKAYVMGEIEELETRKATLQAEVENTASGAAKMIQEAGTEAVASIRQEAGLIKEELTSILEKVLVTGLAVGESAGVQKKGEKAGKELEALVVEVKHQIEKK